MQSQDGHSGMELTENKTKKKAQRITNPQRPRLLGLKAAAQHLGVTEWQMRTLAWNGVISVVQFPNGRKKYFDIGDLDELIKRNKVTYN